jgi:hypothetical protein
MAVTNFRKIAFPMIACSAVGLLAPRSRRANHIARDADDSGIFAEKINGLDGFPGQANDPLWREHP